MKILMLPFFICFSFITVGTAQIDSINVQSYKLRTLFWNEFNNTPSIAQQLPIADFTETSLYATIKNQPLSKAQTPNKVSYYSFNSKGIYTLKNTFKLFGDLDFSRSYSKETSYLLFHNISEEYQTELLPSTNYPLAIRSGDNENLHYKLKGGITGNITKKIPFSATIHYNVAKFYGLTTPKTEQEVVNYSSSFQLGHQFKKHTLFSFLVLEKEQNNFSFNTVGINATRIKEISVPNSYAGFSVGYGDILGFNNTLLAGLVENNTQQFGLGYNYTFKNHFFTLKYTRRENKEHYYSTVYRDENNLASLFTRTQNNIDFSYIKNYASKYLLINSQFTSGKATNAHAFENYIENAENKTVKNNYQHNVYQGTIAITWEKRKNNLAVWSTSFNSKISDNKIEDYNTTQKHVVGLQSAISIHKDFFINPKAFINIETGISYYTPIRKSLEYQSQNSTTSTGESLIPPSNSFGEAVILYDYNYAILQKGGSIFNIQYQQKLQKTSTLIIALNYAFLTAIPSNSITKNNNHLGLRLNLQY